jgi:hypothetical protein
MEAAPLYAQAKFAHELRGILGALAEAEVSPANLSLLRGIDLGARPTTSTSRRHWPPSRI